MKEKTLKSPAGQTAAAARQEDLTEIEGVGPKIAAALNAAGLHTFAAVAATPVERLKEILAAGGEHLKQWDPTTWPEQAALAAKGDWDAFAKLKEELKGGRRV
ncbi:MAG TPA: helix-hairpin-helix domain-containing protein [Verrucomicrobiota bacterium]|nr:helix-hairpin-helix domain-containing protein [Verrucomicrobiota bacterium]HNT13936.1 helix-hairpin-helix domain-containing protein [Verrucomicrobiota bacterium]